MDSWPFNVTDFGVGLAILISAFLAYMRGFVHEALSVGGWIGAIFATIYGFPHLQPFARDLVPLKIAADLGAGAVIFLASLVVLSLLTRAISKRVQASALNALDRSLGFLFGLARGAVLIAMVYLAVEWVLPKEEQPTWIRNAKSMPLIERGAGILWSLLPEKTAQKGARAAGAARKKTRALIEKQGQDALKRMLSPEPKGARATAREGYDARERRQMERLIDAGGK